MKFGIQLPHMGPFASGEGTVSMAQFAEAVGFDSVWVGDHVVYPMSFVERFGPEVFEAVTTLTWVGAATERVQLGTSVLIAPYRNPLVLAKQLATLDVLSRGRTVVGVGVGYLEEEFAAVGTPFNERGDVTDEHLQVMRTLWSEERPSFSGKRFRFPELCARPRPYQQPHPPVWIGGNTMRAMRRAAELGEGWLPVWHAPTGRGFAPRELQQAIAQLTERTQAVGRDVRHTIGGLLPLVLTSQSVHTEALSPLVGAPDQVADGLAALADAGLQHVILTPFYGVSADLLPADLAGVERLLERFMQEVRPQLPN